MALYAGAHGRANAVGQLLDAAEKLRNRPDILIASVGDGTEHVRVEADAKARGLANILFHGPQPKSRMPEIVNACDLGMAVLQNIPRSARFIPTRFSTTCRARAVLLAIDGVARELVCKQARAGVFAEPENGPAIAARSNGSAKTLPECAFLGQSGRQWVLANASRESLAERYLGIMRELVKA